MWKIIGLLFIQKYFQSKLKKLIILISYMFDSIVSYTKLAFTKKLLSFGTISTREDWKKIEQFHEAYTKLVICQSIDKKNCCFSYWRSSLDPRSYTDKSIFRTTNRQAAHWMIKTKFLFAFTEKSLKWRLVQVWDWYKVSLLLLLVLTDVHRKKTFWCFACSC